MQKRFDCRPRLLFFAPWSSDELFLLHFYLLNLVVSHKAANKIQIWLFVKPINQKTGLLGTKGWSSLPFLYGWVGKRCFCISGATIKWQYTYDWQCIIKITEEIPLLVSWFPFICMKFNSPQNLCVGHFLINRGWDTLRMNCSSGQRKEYAVNCNYYLQNAPVAILWVNWLCKWYVNETATVSNWILRNILLPFQLN